MDEPGQGEERVGQALGGVEEYPCKNGEGEEELLDRI